MYDYMYGSQPGVISRTNLNGNPQTYYFEIPASALDDTDGTPSEMASSLRSSGFTCTINQGEV